MCAKCRMGKFTNRQNMLGCIDWNNCLPGTFVSIPGAEISNQKCEKCPYKQYTSKMNKMHCKNWSTICSPGSYVLYKANETADAVCRPCLEGFYTDRENMSKCRPHTLCHTGYDKYGDSLADSHCTRCPSYMTRWPN